MKGNRESAIIVTAVGAVIGYGVVHALRVSSHRVRIIGTDIYPDAVGQFWCDDFDMAVPAADPGYIDYLLALVGKTGAQLVIPGTEYEIEAMHRNRSRLADSGACFLLNNPQIIDTAHDKWKAYEQFKESGIPTIPSQIGNDFNKAAGALGLPMLLKLRRSAAGKGMRVIHSREEFEDALEAQGEDGFLMQPIVGSDEEEYTVSVFGFGDGTAVNGPALRRKLSKAGATDKAWSCELGELDEAVNLLTRTLKPLGPTNYQFRRHEGEFLVMEVNPRISSATSIRQAFGFNEAAMCVDYFVHGVRPEPPVLKRGAAFRYIADHVVIERESP